MSPRGEYDCKMAVNLPYCFCKVSSIDIPEDMLVLKLQLQDKEAPGLKVLTMDNQYQVAYITGVGKYINRMAMCVTDAVVLL